MVRWARFLCLPRSWKIRFFKSNVLDRALTEKIAPTFVHATYPVLNFYPAFGQINGERYLGLALQEVLTGRRDFDADPCRAK